MVNISLNVSVLGAIERLLIEVIMRLIQTVHKDSVFESLNAVNVVRKTEKSETEKGEKAVEHFRKIEAPHMLNNLVSFCNSK